MNTDADKQPALGQLARVLRGREQDQYAVVVRLEDNRFVWIADGDKRKFDQPKKKNILHLHLLPHISSEVADSLNETGRVTNAKLRYALNKFVESQQYDAQQKGE
jgi:ribosomal protein L14E/L6E/L27E